MVSLNKVYAEYKVKVGFIFNAIHPEVPLARAAIKKKNLT